MSLAETTRAAVRARPFLHDALRAGVVNYAAAARLLGEDDPQLADADVETVTAALRRYEADLAPYRPPSGSARVSMRSGLAAVAGEDGEIDGDGRVGEATGPPLLRVGGTAFVDGGSLTGILARGTVDARLLADVLGRLDASDVPVRAAGVADESLTVVVDRRDGPTALRLVEAAV
jgi:hypothetical protein